MEDMKELLNELVDETYVKQGLDAIYRVVELDGNFKLMSNVLSKDMKVIFQKNGYESYLLFRHESVREDSKIIPDNVYVITSNRDIMERRLEQIVKNLRIIDGQLFTPVLPPLLGIGLSYHKNTTTPEVKNDNFKITIENQSYSKKYKSNFPKKTLKEIDQYVGFHENGIMIG